MDTANLISSLVDTYKDLNMRYRNNTGTDQAKAILFRMRDDEVAFSQALKDHLTGVGTNDGSQRETTSLSESTFTQLISQFGTARATTLNLLKGIDGDAGWNLSTQDGMTVRSHVEQLVQSDQNQMERLRQALAG